MHPRFSELSLYRKSDLGESFIQEDDVQIVEFGGTISHINSTDCGFKSYLQYTFTATSRLVFE